VLQGIDALLAARRGAVKSPPSPSQPQPADADVQSGGAADGESATDELVRRLSGGRNGPSASPTAAAGGWEAGGWEGWDNNDELIGAERADVTQGARRCAEGIALAGSSCGIPLGHVGAVLGAVSSPPSHIPVGLLIALSLASVRSARSNAADARTSRCLVLWASPAGLRSSMRVPPLPRAITAHSIASHAIPCHPMPSHAMPCHALATPRAALLCESAQRRRPPHRS
jgi:hypothetical protein